jgi:uncharacterized membrane protein
MSRSAKSQASAPPSTSPPAGQEVPNVHGGSGTGEDDEGPGQGMSRLLALSDDVFAVAITLLVFNLGVAPGQPLAAGLAHFGDRAWAAALSFVLVGRFWMVHRRIFARVRLHDDRLLVLNLVFLAAIVTMPFATELLTHPGDRPVQVVTYAGLVGIAALLSTAIWCYAFAAHLTGDRLPTSQTAVVIASGLPGPLVTALVCLVSAAVAWVEPTAGELVWVALAVPSGWLAPRFLPLARRLAAADWRPRTRRDRAASPGKPASTPPAATVLSTGHQLTPASQGDWRRGLWRIRGTEDPSRKRMSR